MNVNANANVAILFGRLASQEKMVKKLYIAVHHGKGHTSVPFFISWVGGREGSWRERFSSVQW